MHYSSITLALLIVLHFVMLDEGSVNTMKIPKKVASFRLSETTIKELAILAKKFKVGQADVIAVLVHFACVGGDFDNLDEWFDIASLA